MTTPDLTNDEVKALRACRDRLVRLTDEHAVRLLNEGFVEVTVNETRDGEFIERYGATEAGRLWLEKLDERGAQ